MSENTPFCKKSIFRCGERLLDLSSPKIMGILNVSPESFYDGGNYTSEKEWLTQTERMMLEGAEFIDVGGMSSRPGAQPISEAEELNRIIPVIQSIKKIFPDLIISVDTFRSSVATAAIGEGASIVNDISAARFDERLLDVVREHQIPYVLMHMQGTPADMQQHPVYENILHDLSGFFVEKLNLLKQKGIHDVILDPGFGFGKTVEHNYNLLKNLGDLRIFGLPLMVGISRKSMICKVLKVNPEKALNGTTALHSLALLKGADILRVHDVREAKEVINLMQYYKNAN